MKWFGVIAVIIGLIVGELALYLFLDWLQADQPLLYSVFGLGFVVLMVAYGLYFRPRQEERKWRMYEEQRLRTLAEKDASQEDW